MNKRPSLSRLLAAILSGLLLAAAFPKRDETYLLIFALVPLLWALRGASLKAAFWLGLVSNSGPLCGAALLDRLRHPRLREMSLIAAVWPGICVSTPRCGGWESPGAPPGASVCSGGPRPLRGSPGVGADLQHHQRFPLEPLGNGLYQYPRLLQLADITGVYGLSFMVL